MIKTKAPGKLYIAGEYAVLEPGNPAILVAVDRFIYASIKESLYKGSITSYGKNPVLWTREGDKLVLDKNKDLLYVRAAINIVEEYAKELGKNLLFYNLKVDSELDAEEGKKYGLGSSAAVTVAVVEALCLLYKINISKEVLFKLSALAHLDMGNNGSCGDVAASVYGGWIVFSTFHNKWVLDQREKSSISELLNKSWKDLSIKALKPPEQLKLVVGWTRSPASTTNLVHKVKQGQLEKPELYKEFLMKSKDCVVSIVKAFHEENVEEIQNQIRINRQLLINLGTSLSVAIETPSLSNLCNIALEFNGACKSSGAGGGDCGIVIFKKADSVDGLIKRWEDNNISCLSLKVYEKKGDNNVYK